MPEQPNETLLHELINIIRSTSISHKPGIPDCMRYLLGDKFDSFLYSDAYLYQVYNEEICLPIEAIEAIRTSVNWDVRRLKENFPKSEISAQALSDNIRPLYNKYITDSGREKGLNSMLRSLLHLYFFGITDAPPLFVSYEKRNVKDYIPPEDYINAAKSILEKNNVLILTGAPGMGKTELAKRLVAQSCAPYKDIGWLEVPYDATHISDCFGSIHFYNQSTDDTVRENEILKWLERKPKSSYLIINAPVLYDDDFHFIKDYLYTLRIRIIITTRTPVIPCCESSKLALENYTGNFLTKIFQKTCSDNFFSKEEYSKLFDIVCCNPYIVTLVAKSIQQHPEAIGKSDLLDKEQWLWHKKQLPKIHSSYNDPGSKPELPLLTLTSRILDNYPPAFLINTASRLSIWARQEIRLDYLKKSFTPSDIDTALQNGILQFTDEAQKTVQMPALLADTIWFNYPIDYSDYQNEISQFLSKICIGHVSMVPIDTLYGLIENIVYRFHFNIVYLKTRPSSGEKKQFFEWNAFLMQIVF